MLLQEVPRRAARVCLRARRRQLTDRRLQAHRAGLEARVVARLPTAQRAWALAAVTLGGPLAAPVWYATATLLSC